MSTPLTRQLLAIAIVVVAAVTATMVAITVATRLARTAAQRRFAERTRTTRPLVLTVAAGEDDDGSAGRALSALPAHDRDAAQELIVTLLPKVHGGPAEALVELLERFGAIERAIDDLAARSAVTRAAAVYLLGLTRDARAGERLRPLLHDPSREVRIAAVEALGRIRCEDAALEVIETLRSSHGRPGVPVSAVAEALMAMGPGIAWALRAAVEDADAAARYVAAVVGGRGLFRAIAPELRRLLDGDESEVVREAGADALGRLGDPDDVDTLAAATADDRPAPLRRLATEAMGELGEPTAAPVLESLLGDSDRRLAEIAALALLELGQLGRQILATVCELGGSPRPAAAFALDLDRLRAGSRGIT